MLCKLKRFGEHCGFFLNSSCWLEAGNSLVRHDLLIWGSGRETFPPGQQRPTVQGVSFIGSHNEIIRVCISRDLSHFLNWHVPLEILVLFLLALLSVLKISVELILDNLLNMRLILFVIRIN